MVGSRRAWVSGCLIVLVILAGCSGSKKEPNNPSPSNTSERSYDLSESQSVSGAFQRGWAWIVHDTQYKSFSVRLNVSAPDGQDKWSATDWYVDMVDGAGNSAYYIPGLDIDPPQSGSSPVIKCDANGPQFHCTASQSHYKNGAPTATGTWTLKLNATESSMKYTVAVHLTY